MNLEPLDLKNHLIKMGMSTLQKIIGKEELRSISLITNKSINEIMISELLIKSSGTEIFSDKFLRGNLINSLPNNYKSYLEFGDYNKILSPSEEQQLINRPWNRNFHSHFRLIKIFNLTEEYLPNEKLEDKNIYILKKEFLNQKNNFLVNLMLIFFNFLKSFFIKKKRKFSD